MLYDEGCRFCTAVAEALAARGLVVAAIGSPAGDTWLRDLAHHDRYAAFHAVDGAGRRRSGGAAVPLVLDALPGGRLAAALARRTPRATHLGYVLVARHRRTLSFLSRAPRLPPGRRRARERSRGARPAS